MSRPLRSPICCIAGCSRPALDDGCYALDESLCADHASAASPRLRARLQSTLRRHQRLENVWSDVERYEAVVGTGRYLKLCDATQTAMDQMDSAWMRVKLDVILSDANRKRGAAPTSDSQLNVAQAR